MAKVDNRKLYAKREIAVRAAKAAVKRRRGPLHKPKDGVDFEIEPVPDLLIGDQYAIILKDLPLASERPSPG